MFWSWMCLLLSVVVLLIGYEIVLTPNALKGKYNSTLCANKNDIISPSERVILFLIDGMRNDAADSNWISRIVTHYGRGVAIAGRPMTRTGLVSIFSGCYEDILSHLSIFSYDNYIDNLFRHVDYTYYFGPDVTRTYFKDSNKWISKVFPNKWLDLKKRTDLGDDYVMDGIQEMFNNSLKKLVSHKVIFHIYLSGVDLAGHSISRRGNEFRLDQAMNKVGNIINNTVTLFEKYFRDKKSAYIIVSDHGMTYWGTHGDSLPEEIRTPVIMWGSGVANGIHPAIKQIDLCPILAAILGTSVPTESIGVLHKEYLNLSHSSLAYSTMCTALQLANLCQSTWEQIERGLLIKHILARTMTSCKYKRYFKTLTTLMSNNSYSSVVKVSGNLTKLSLQCLTNVQNFYKASFLFLLLMSYFAWIFGTICMLSSIVPVIRIITCTGKLIIIFTCLGYMCMAIFSVGSVILERMPTYYIIYMVVPSLAWLITSLNMGICLAKFLRANQCKVFLFATATLAMVEFLYWAKYYPYMFSAYLLPYACTLATINYKFVPQHVTIVWIISSIALVIGPLIPVLGYPESAVLLNVSSGLWIVGICFFAYVLNLRAKQCMVTLSLTAIICLTTWIIDLTYFGSNLILKILAWSVLPLPLLVFFTSSNLAERLFHVTVSMVGPYQLLSIRHESIVLLVMAINLYCLLRLEASSPQYDEQIFVRGITLYYYLILGLFASGNMPYISSFDTTWTSLFTTILEHKVMGCLIAYKLTIILTVIVCFFCATCAYIGTPPKEMFLISILTAALSSIRHCTGIIISKEPLLALPEFILGNLLFIILIIPFNLAPVLVYVKKNRNKK